MLLLEKKELLATFDRYMTLFFGKFRHILVLLYMHFDFLHLRYFAFYYYVKLLKATRVL